MTQKKGQVGFIIGILGFFMALATVAFLMTPMLQFIDIGINATNSSEHGALLAVMLNSLPVFVVLVLMISLFVVAQYR